MAKMKKCIKQFKEDYVDSDSPAIINTILAMDVSNNASEVTRRAIGFVDAAIANVGTREENYQKQLVEKVSIFKNKQLKANHYVSKKAGDPTNELNTFSAQSLKKLVSNFFQRVSSFTDVVNPKFISKHKINKAEEAVLKNMHNQFLPEFEKAIEEIFKYKNNRPFLKNDFIQYFVDIVYENDADIRGSKILSTIGDKDSALADADGNPIGTKLDATLKGVLAATVYDYLMHSPHTFLQNNYNSMKNILNIDDKDAMLPPGAQPYLMDIGSRSTYLAEDIGKGIAQRLGIQPGKDSDYLAQARLEKSLGLMALSTLEQMGVIERLDIYTGLDSEGNVIGANNKEDMIGLEALKAGMGTSLLKRDIDIHAEKGVNKKGTPTTAFYRFKEPQFAEEDGFQTIPKDLEKQKEAYDLAPNAISKLYGKENLFKEFSFSQPVYADGQKFRIGRSNQVATAEQANRLKTYNKKAWVPSASVQEAFFALDPAIQKTLLGFRELDTVHIDNQENQKGINLGIVEDINRMVQYRRQVAERRDAGESTDIFIESEFWNTMRMGQLGTIKPQGSKFHRAMLSMKKWEHTFVVTEPDNKGNYDETSASFLFAIAQQLDIESGKLGGMKGQRDKFFQTINSDDGREALNLAYQLHETGELSIEAQERLVALIEPFETKAIALRALIEYARYERTPVGSEFTTDIFLEIDGIGNGMAIATAQLSGSGVDRRSAAAALAMAGWNFTGQDENIDEQLHHKESLDAYQRLGHLWGENIAVYKATGLHVIDEENKRAIAERDDLTEEEIEYTAAMISALEGIVKPLYESTGEVSKAARGLSKYRTMQTLFGSGLGKQIGILVQEDIIAAGITNKLEYFANEMQSWNELTASEDKAKTVNALKDLLLNVRTLTGQSFGTDNGFAEILTDGKLDPKKLLDLHLDYDAKRAIASAADTLYKKPLQAAIETIYGGMNDTKTPFNKSVSMMIVAYNNLLDAKIKQLQADKLAADTTMQEINAEIEKNNALPDNKDKQKALQTPVVTVGEMRTIVDSLAIIFPKIRSPFYEASSDTGYLDLAHKARNHKNGMTARVEQRYTSGTVSQHTAVVSGYPYLEDSGVSPIVNSIHMEDSFVANSFIGTDRDIFNVHDASIGGIADHKAMEEIDNTAFQNEMENYYLGKEFQKTFSDFITNAAPIMSAYGVTSASMLEDLISARVISVDEVATAFFGGDTQKLFAQFKKEFSDNMDLEAKVRAYINSKLPTVEGKHKFVQNVLTGLRRKIKTEAEATAKNKDAFMKNNTNMTQYSGGMGGLATNNEHSDELFPGEFDPVNTATITQIDRASTNDRSGNIEFMLQSEQTFGSSNETISTNENAYPDSVDIDSQSAVEVLNSIIDMDNQAGYTMIKDSAAHQEYLQNFVAELTDNVMRPLELYVRENPDVNQETVGTLTSTKEGTNSKIFIEKQNESNAAYPQPGILGQGIRMSTAETYAHELTHHMTHMGLSGDRNLRYVAKSLFNQAYAGFKNKYGEEAYRVFLNDPTINVYDSANRFEVEAAKDRWNYIFETPGENSNRTKSSMYDEFVTHGVTNENFIRELSTLEVKSPTNNKAFLGIFEKNIQTSLINLFGRIKNFVFNKTKYSLENGTMDKELNRLVQALAKQDGAKKNALIQYAWDMEAKATLWATAKDKQVREVVKKAVNKRPVVQLWHKAKSVPELDNMISQGMRNVRGWYNDKEYGIVASAITEVKGLTGRMAPLHNLQHKRNLILDMEKKEKASVMLKLVNEFFDRDLSSKEKSAVTKAFVKTDLHAIYQRGGINAVQNYVSSASDRATRIAYLQNQINQDPELSQYQHFFGRASAALGQFMTTARANKENVPLMNAHNIARMAGSEHEGRLTPAAQEKVHQIVDEMASLYSLNYVAAGDLAIASSLLSENSKSIENVLLQHGLFKEDALKGSFNNHPAKMLKGYTRAVLSPRVEYIQGTLEDAEHLEAQGFIRNEKPLPSDPDDPEQRPLYMYKSTLGMANSFVSQIASLTTNVMRGTDSWKIQNIHRGATGSNITRKDSTLQAEADEETMIDVAADRINNMFSPAPAINDDNDNVMVPKFDDTGKISGMRYIMNESTKDNVLEQISDVDAIFAKLAETAVDKAVTPVINDELVEALGEMYQSDFAENPEAYVEISPYSDKAHYREIYYMLPPRARQKILEVFPDGRMKVAKDVIDLAFGTRKFTITEMFGETAKDRGVFTSNVVAVAGFALGINVLGMSKYKNRQGRIKARAKFVEDTMKQVASLVKNNIVVRNLKVVMGNYSSNIAYLKSRGMTMEEIQTGSMEAVEGAMEYQNLNMEIQNLQQKRILYDRKRGVLPATKTAFLKNIDRKIAQLQNDLELNPATAMMRAGLMTAIVDDIDTDLTQQNYEYGVDALISNTMGKLPTKVQSVARTMFLTTDGEGYKQLNNGVKMTDFVGRYVLYHHYVNKKGMDHETALGKVNEEFINFSLPTHKMIEYGNNIGVVWFSKYQLRVLKQILTSVADKPFTAISTFILTSLVGSGNILNSIPGITKDLMQAFNNPVGMLNDSVGSIATIDAATGLFD